MNGISTGMRPNAFSLNLNERNPSNKTKGKLEFSNLEMLIRGVDPIMW